VQEKNKINKYRFKSSQTQKERDSYMDLRFSKGNANKDVAVNHVFSNVGHFKPKH